MDKKNFAVYLQPAIFIVKMRTLCLFFVKFLTVKCETKEEKIIAELMDWQQGSLNMKLARSYLIIIIVGYMMGGPSRPSYNLIVWYLGLRLHYLTNFKTRSILSKNTWFQSLNIRNRNNRITKLTISSSRLNWEIFHLEIISGVFILNSLRLRPKEFPKGRPGSYNMVRIDVSTFRF